MPLSVTCAACSKTFSVPDHFAGRTGKCTQCGAAIVAQAPAPAQNAPNLASSDQLESFPQGGGAHPAPAAPPSAAASPSSIKVGDLVGKYKVQKHLGDAKSRVFLAQSPEGTVALKLLPQQTSAAGQTVAKRFLREARSLFGLDHPNVVKILDAGEELGCLYLAMEHFESKTVRELLAERGGRLSEAEALKITAQAARGLSHLAARGLVHRNVKPEHLLVGTGATVKLAGLGLVKATEPEEEGNLTVKGMVVGTPQYLSPEQAQSEAELDVRSDLFSLGVTLYEMLAGVVPWSDKQPLRVIRALMTQPAPPLKEKNPAVRDQTVAIVEKLLQKTPDARYASPDELVQALAAVGVKLPELPAAPAAPAAPAKKTTAPRPAASLEAAPSGSDALVKKLLVAVFVLGGLVLLLGVAVAVLVLNK